jgi:membrane protease subunit (stomatin/prohibitin family)
MGFINDFKVAISVTLSDQWVDFLTVPAGITPTAAIFPAVPKGQNNGRGANTKGSVGIITNGSRIVIPEGYGLITLQEGGITGLITEAGGYTYTSDDQNSKSIFTGGGILSSTLETSWERFKFGGQPGAQQLAFFVNLKEIPNNRFGTQSEIFFDDAYLNAQVGAVTRGSYTLLITDPLLFVKNIVPASYFFSGNSRPFDFTDMDNPVSAQLFNEVVASLAPAFSKYTNDPDKSNRISRIQGDSLGFGQSLSAAVEEGYQWKTGRGLEIVHTAIIAIEYDEDTRKLLSDVKKADALSGNRSGSFLNQAVARGVQSAGETGGGAGLAMFGIGAGGVGGLVQPVGQQTQPTAAQPQTVVPTQSAEDPYAKLRQLKGLLDDGVISQEEFDAAKVKVLGL